MREHVPSLRRTFRERGAEVQHRRGFSDAAFPIEDGEARTHAADAMLNFWYLREIRLSHTATP